jgi:DNA-binding LacI/PurR family transcriptional regulator
MRLVVRQLKHRGYKRPGLVLESNLSARVDRAWLAAYSLHEHDLPARDRVPPAILNAGTARQQFKKWFELHRPEVILHAGLPVWEWLKDLKLCVPDDVGLVHLDWSEDVGNLSGIDADAEAIGAAAVDLLVGQLHAHEYGIPEREKIVLVKGKWHEGKTLRPAGVIPAKK